MYGASTEQVRSKYQLGNVSKMRKIRIKRKNNFCFSYKKKVYRGSGKGCRTHVRLNFRNIAGFTVQGRIRVRPRGDSEESAEALNIRL